MSTPQKQRSAPAYPGPPNSADHRLTRELDYSSSHLIVQFRNDAPESFSVLRRIPSPESENPKKQKQ